MKRGLPTPRLTARIDQRSGAIPIAGERGRKLRNVPHTCSGCGSLEHNIRRCAKEQR